VRGERGMIKLGKEDAEKLKDTVDSGKLKYNGRVFREFYISPFCFNCGFRYAVYVSDGYGLFIVGLIRGLFYELG
jgi:hypothetical protein